jgi:hypothetical protein
MRKKDLVFPIFFFLLLYGIFKFYNFNPLLVLVMLEPLFISPLCEAISCFYIKISPYLINGYQYIKCILYKFNSKYLKNFFSKIYTPEEYIRFLVTQYDNSTVILFKGKIRFLNRPLRGSELNKYVMREYFHKFPKDFGKVLAFNLTMNSSNNNLGSNGSNYYSGYSGSNNYSGSNGSNNYSGPSSSNNNSGSSSSGALVISHGGLTQITNYPSLPLGFARYRPELAPESLKYLERALKRAENLNMKYYDKSKSIPILNINGINLDYTSYITADYCKVVRSNRDLWALLNQSTLVLPVAIKVGPSQHVFIQEAFEADVTCSRMDRKLPYGPEAIGKLVENKSTAIHLEHFKKTTLELNKLLNNEHSTLFKSIDKETLLFQH